ncbi:MAG: hypothetical protein LBH42_04275 [Treponema sp.]|jgi:hypothetical protein|nr:hypothetical protein [Treponema sp.]
MTDQEIRAKALELTIKAWSFLSEDVKKHMIDGFKSNGDDTVTYPFVFHCRRFEEYIREGEMEN